MSEEVNEVFLPHIRVPLSLKDAIEDLGYLELKGDKLRLFSVTDVMREALVKGVQLMYMEREMFDEMVRGEAKEGALRIQASLVRATDAMRSQTAVVKREESVKKGGNKNGRRRGI